MANTANTEEFLLQSYDYNLPSELIANHPINPKENARLLVYNRLDQSITHTYFSHLFDYIPKTCLLVFNDTKVLKARIYGAKQSGGRIEIFLHRHYKDSQFSAQIRGRVKEGECIALEEGLSARVVRKLENGLRILEFLQEGRPLEVHEVYEMLERLGHIPLPPYIKRSDGKEDERDYQSVFAKYYGAIAAPTASLHFSDSMMERVEREYESVFLTLHVGAGTFMNVESSDIRAHQIHSEILHISAQVAHKISQANEILCIGTTAMRSVEFLARQKSYDAYSGECDIFLHLGNKPRKTSHLLTNFHLPKSTLLMLVSSMVGLDECRRIYAQAIQEKYRFYSYGDGMLIL